MASKTKLICTRTNGRWNKGDVASFDSETAKKLTAGKKPAWQAAKEAPTKKTAEDGGGTGKAPTA